MLDVNDSAPAVDRARHRGPDPHVVERRGEEAGDDQLPHAQAREGRPLLREDLRSDQGLGVLLRQVQARPLQGHHLRALWRRGHALEGAPRAHGPHRARRARHAHLVLQGCPEPARLPARHRAEEPREGHLLRRAHHHVGRRRAPAQGPRRSSRPTSAPRSATSSSERELELRKRDEEYEAELEELEEPRRQEERARAGREGRATRTSRTSAPVPTPRSSSSRRCGTPSRASRPSSSSTTSACGASSQDRYEEYFAGGMGAEAVKDLISRLDMEAEEAVPQGDHRHREGPAQGQGDQAPQGHLGVQPRRRRRPQDQLADGHGPRRGPGDPARPAPDGAARRWPLRDLRPQRPLPPRDQPQQPAEAAPRPRRARDHHQQREAHAAGGRRRAVRQRPPRPPGHGPRQPRAQVALRHAEGQAGPVPPEPARQARRLLGPFGHRRRPAAQAAAVRSAQADGARAVQAVRDEAARRPRVRAEHQVGQAHGRARPPAGVGRARRGHQGAPGVPEPCANAPPSRHPGLRAGAGRGQGDPDPPARVHGVQRRLRR